MKDRPFPSTAFHSPVSVVVLVALSEINKNPEDEETSEFMTIPGSITPPWHFTSAQLRPWLVQAPTIAATKASAVWAMHWWPCWSRRRQVEYQSYGFSGSWLDGKSQGIIGHQWIASNLATSYDTVWSCLGVVSLVRQAFLQQLPTRTTTIGDRLLNM